MTKILQGSCKPDWDRLYETAAAQSGHFTSAQADEAGYSPQLLAKYLKSRRIVRVRRGVYRLVHFPSSEQEELTVVWLWTEQAGVFSHETALFLHDLSDAMSARVHVTLPLSWKSRRLRVPDGVCCHFSEVSPADRSWFGPVPVTTVARTLVDCAKAQIAPDFVCDAFEEAAERGLIDRNALPIVLAYLKRFFSVSRSHAGPRFRSSSRSVSRSQ